MPEGKVAQLGLRRHALVAIGGGKDSLVSIEALRKAGVAQTVPWIGGSPLIRACAERTGLTNPHITPPPQPQRFEAHPPGPGNGPTTASPAVGEESVSQ